MWKTLSQLIYPSLGPKIRIGGEYVYYSEQQKRLFIKAGSIIYARLLDQKDQHRILQNFSVFVCQGENFDVVNSCPRHSKNDFFKKINKKITSISFRISYSRKSQRNCSIALSNRIEQIHPNIQRAPRSSIPLGKHFWSEIYNLLQFPRTRTADQKIPRTWLESGIQRRIRGYRNRHPCDGKP